MSHNNLWILLSSCPVHALIHDRICTFLKRGFMRFSCKGELRWSDLLLITTAVYALCFPSNCYFRYILLNGHVFIVIYEFIRINLHVLLESVVKLKLNFFPQVNRTNEFLLNLHNNIFRSLFMWLALVL